MRILNNKNLDDHPAPVITNMFDEALDTLEEQRKKVWVEELRITRGHGGHER